MQIHTLTPTSLAIFLLALFPTPTIHPEPVYALSAIKPVRALVMPAMPSYTALEVAPFPYLPMGTLPNPYAAANCTWGVASMKKSIPGDWGNAAEWVAHARAAGITVSDIPIVGSVAQHGGGYGHVGLVVGIRPGEILLEEMNFDYNGSVRTTWQPVSSYVYIYI